MKAPAYFVDSVQRAINIGLNGFALTLMAESFADKAEKFGGENVVFLAHAHSGQEVWFIMTKDRPRAEWFAPVQCPANGEASNTGAQGVQADLGSDSGVQSEGGRAEERA